MSDDPSPRPCRRFPVWAEATLVAAGLILHFALSQSAASRKSMGFDEITHITGGVSHLRTGDYRLNTEQGILPQRWAAWPVAAGSSHFPSPDEPAWQHSDELALGHQFLHGMGNDLARILRSARGMIGLLSVALGLLVYAWSRSLFGAAGGIVSLFLFAFSPTTLAHGALVTSDMALALTLTATAAAWSWALRRVTGFRIALSAVAVALAVLSKSLAVIVLALIVLLALIRVAAPAPLPVGRRAPFRMLRSRSARAAALAAIIVLQVAVAVGTLWMVYGFRFRPFLSPSGTPAEYLVTWAELSADPSASTKAVLWLRERRLLPEGYLWGLAFAGETTGSRKAFLAGQYSVRGWWYFFPMAILIKSSLVTLLLALAGKIVLLVGRPRFARLKAGIPLLAYLILYGLALVMSPMNIGHRHALALYPPLFILAGAVPGLARRWKKPFVLHAVLCLLLLAQCLTAVRAWPNYLAYFNPLIGGSDRGYRWLVDSSCDWGQDLLELKRWTEARASESQARPLYLAYFGTDSPEYYGISMRYLLPSTFSPRRPVEAILSPGAYAVSATLLQAVHILPMGRWCERYETDYQQARRWFTTFQDPAQQPGIIAQLGHAQIQDQLYRYEHLRFGRLAAFLRRRKPDDRAGQSILIYDLTAEDLRQALDDPPAELESSHGVH